VNTTYGTFCQTNDQINFGDHTQRLGYFASINDDDMRSQLYIGLSR
jgi:hypothetical protein